jgi:hypothetical protein
MRRITLGLIMLIVTIVVTIPVAAQDGIGPSVRNLGGTDILVNGGFEDLTGWTAASDDGAPVLCTTGVCEIDDTQAPHTGLGFARLGSVGAGTEASISQSVVLPKDEFLVLTFNLWLGNPDLAPGTSESGFVDTDFLSVSIDGQNFWFSDPYYLDHQYGYGTFATNLSAYADGLPHTLAFTVSSGEYDETPSIWSIDNVALYVLDATNIVVNGGFEGPNGEPLLAPWKPLDGAKVKCNKATKVVSKEGACALKAKFTYTIRTSQKVDVAQLSQPILAGDIISLTTSYAVKGSGFASAYLGVRFDYTNGTREKIVFAPQGHELNQVNVSKARALSLNYVGTLRNYLSTMISADVSKVKIPLCQNG